MKNQLLDSLFSLSLILSLSGCGGSNNTNNTTSTAINAQLIDSYLENVDYICADGKHDITDINGSFSCNRLPVTFKLSNLTLGSVSTLENDRQVFPQEILGVERTEVNNTTVIAMARFLQSCDEDNNTANGIQIKAEVINAFKDLNRSFNMFDLEIYASDANITLIDETTALNHLKKSVDFITAVDSVLNLPLSVKEILLTPNSNLTQEVKNTLSYMGNEERLAFDVYNYLYIYHLNNNTAALPQLANIASRSEYTHIQTVQLLIKKYITSPDEFTNIDLAELNYKDTSIEDMQAGTYDISTIADLYSSLITKGEQSPQDALEVGCMVEVTDIDDLLTDIDQAEDSNASDIVTAFEFLRDGSYRHYWAFDKGLKDMGVTEGCCSLESQYCHPEYPQPPRSIQ